ncbi:hypothetical protein H0H81_005749 [Sphagnurus paluster]|uniref:Uncharacterized protein n=1 Tax=Sphagnurus paluster TaxID=117069 RepID=A0A9P7K6T9_9AGAR|nr:hypothetical protein H0H81_005749 [Sphagnurus paluster]
MSFIEKDPRTDSWLSGITNWWGAVEYCNLIIQAFIGDIGVAIGTKGDENTSRSKIEPYIISMLVLTLITNAISSSLIVYRIWSISKESSRYRTNPSQDPSPKAIRVTVEAGLLYTTTMVVMTTLYLLGHNAYVPITRVIVQIIGITFNLVIIRSIRRPEEVYMVPCIRTMVTTEIIVTRDVHTVSDSDHSRDVEKESVKKDDW